jgi:uncharacterized protein (DUF433 family)
MAKLTMIHEMEPFPRITFDPQIMGGRACIRGMRVTVSMILGLLESGRTHEEILRAFPYLEPEDLSEALRYAPLLPTLCD